MLPAADVALAEEQSLRFYVCTKVAWGKKWERIHSGGLVDAFDAASRAAGVFNTTVVLRPPTR